MTTNNINNASSDLTISDIELTGSTIATLPTNANLFFAPNGTANLFMNRLSFNNGIDYLNFYTITTFTPTIGYQLGGGSGMTYSLQQGIRVRFGAFYYMSCNIILTSKGIAVGGDDAFVANGISSSGLSFTTANYVPCLVKNVNYTVTYPNSTEVKYFLNFSYFNVTNSGSTSSLGNFLRYRDINNNSEFYWSGVFVTSATPT
jgi:hypothetical protein